LKILYDSSRPGAEVVRVLAVHKDTLKLHNEEVKALVEAHLKWMPALSTMKTGLDPVLRREGIDAETFHDIVQKLEVPSREQNIQWLTGSDPWLQQKMRMLARELGISETGQLSHLDEVLDPEFVKQTP
jgi:hypothetical protein